MADTELTELAGENGAGEDSSEYGENV